MKKLTIHVPAALVVTGVALLAASALRAATYESSVKVVPASRFVAPVLGQDDGETLSLQQPLATASVVFNGTGGTILDLQVPNSNIPEDYLPNVTVRIWDGTCQYRTDAPPIGPAPGDPIAGSREWAPLPWAMDGIVGKHEMNNQANIYYLHMEMVLQPDPAASPVPEPLYVYENLLFDISSLQSAPDVHDFSELTPP